MHDAAIAGLRIENDSFLVIPHNVHISLLEVPSVDIEAEEVQAGHVAVELAFEHVEVAVEIHEDGVKDQGLIALVAVQGFFSAH